MKMKYFNVVWVRQLSELQGAREENLVFLFSPVWFLGVCIIT